MKIRWVLTFIPMLTLLMGSKSAHFSMPTQSVDYDTAFLESKSV